MKISKNIYSVVTFSLLLLMIGGIYYMFSAGGRRFVERQMEDALIYAKLLGNAESGVMKSVSFFVVSKDGRVIKKIPSFSSIDISLIANEVSDAFSGKSSCIVVGDMIYAIVPVKDGVAILKKKLQNETYFAFIPLLLIVVAFSFLLLWFAYLVKREIKTKENLTYKYKKRLLSLWERLKRVYFSLGSLLNSTDYMFMFVDSDGGIVCVSKAIREIFLVRKGYLWKEINNVELKKVIKSAIASKEVVEADIEEKGRIYQVRCLPLHHRGSWFFMVRLLDVTEKRRISTAKAEIVSDISHELKTPISVIKGCLEMLDDTDKEEQKSLLQTVNKKVEQLAAIVDSITLLHRVEAQVDGNFKQEDVYLVDILDKVVGEFKNVLQDKGLELRMEVLGLVRPVRGVAELLYMAFRNLMDNAVKYTPSGSIRVVIGPYANEYVKVDIIDTGIGIPDRELGRVFDRFFVGDSSRHKGPHGSGIGLAIVKHIIENHGGYVYVDSRVGSGSAFTVVLPVVSSSVVASKNDG